MKRNNKNKNEIQNNSDISEEEITFKKNSKNKKNIKTESDQEFNEISDNEESINLHKRNKDNSENENEEFENSQNEIERSEEEEEELNNISYLNEDDESDNELKSKNRQKKGEEINEELEEEELREENNEEQAESEEEEFNEEEEENEESEEMVELDEFSEQLIEETIKLLKEEEERLKEINLELLEIRITNRNYDEKNNQLIAKVEGLQSKLEAIDRKIDSLIKLEKHNNYQGFNEYDVFAIQKKCLDMIDNGERTYKMIYKKESLPEEEIFEEPNLNYIKYGENYNSDGEKERFRDHALQSFHHKSITKELVNPVDDEIYKICIAYKNKSIIYQLKIKTEENMNFIQFKTEAMKEFYIDITDYKYFYLSFQGAYLNNNDLVLPFLNYLIEKNIPMNFILEKSNQSTFKKNLNKKEKKDSQEKNPLKDQNEEKKKLLELQGNFYNSEIAYLEAQLKMKSIDEEAEQFKKGQGQLFNKIAKISQNYANEREKKKNEYKERNSYFLDPEDHYFNAKEFCFEIQKLEWEEKMKKDEIIRKDKVKKDNPIIITYNDVFKLRLQQAFIFYMYLIFLFCFMILHRFSSFDDIIEFNANNYLENVFIKNPIMKNFIDRPSPEKMKKGYKFDDYITNSRDWIIYQNFILNNLMLQADGQTDYRKSYNKIMLTNNVNHNSAVYGATELLQFNHKFSKKHKFEFYVNETNTLNDYSKSRFMQFSFQENDTSLDFNSTNFLEDKNKEEQDKESDYKNTDTKGGSIMEDFIEKIEDLFIHKFLDQDIKICDHDYLEFKNTFIPKVELKELILELGDSWFFGDIKDRTIPLKIPIEKLNTSNDTKDLNFFNFLKNETINNKQDFEYDEELNTVEIYFKNISSSRDDVEMPGKLMQYKNTGFKVYYDLSKHDPSLYDGLGQNILKNLYAYEELRYSNIDFTLTHNRFNLPIRILINFEISNLGYTHSHFIIQIIDFNGKKSSMNIFSWNPVLMFYKLAVYGIYAHLIISIISNIYNSIKFREYKISIYNKTPILLDCFSLILIIRYEWIFRNLSTQAGKIDRNQEKGATIDESTLMEQLNYIKKAKAILTFMLTMRIFTMLNQSILITFFIRIFRGFYKKLNNIYLLSITVILGTSIYLFASSKNIMIPTFYEGIIMTRNILYDAIDSRIFVNSSKFALFGTFVFLIICKAFVFSLFIAGIKTVVDEEVTIYNNSIKKLKKNLIGDYLVFLFIFIFKVLSGYIIYEYKYLNKLDEEILQKVKIGLNSFGGNEQKIINEKSLKDLDRKQIETFYKFFQEKTELLLLNATYITELNEKFYMEKIELPNRDVYLIIESSKRHKEKLKERKKKNNSMFNKI